MKILSLTTSFPHSDNKSSGIFVYHLLAALADKNQVTVVTPSFRGKPHAVDCKNMRVISCRYAPASFEHLAHAPGGVPAALRNHFLVSLFLLCVMMLSLTLRAFIAGFSNDVIHANWAVCGLMALPLKIFRKPLIVTLRGEDVTRAQKKRLSRYLLGVVITYADHIITVSQEMKAWIDSNYDKPNKVTFIGNGIADTFLAVGRERDYAVRRSAVECVMVGSLIPRKNVAFVLQSLHQVSSSIPWSLTVIGDGPERASLSALAQHLGIEDNIFFCGGQSQTTIAEHLGTAQVFLFSSLSEGRPNVVIEAMAAGLAILAPRISGVNELIEHDTTGLLFESNNTAEFINLFTRLLTEREIVDRLGRSAFRSIESHSGSWQSVAERYDGIFRQFLRC